MASVHGVAGEADTYWISWQTEYRLLKKLQKAAPELHAQTRCLCSPAPCSLHEAGILLADRLWAAPGERRPAAQCSYVRFMKQAQQGIVCATEKLLSPRPPTMQLHQPRLAHVCSPTSDTRTWKTLINSLCQGPEESYQKRAAWCAGEWWSCMQSLYSYKALLKK